MPPLQVIQRQNDPGAQFISEQGQQVAQNLRANQALQATLMQTKINMQNAGTEEEKLKFNTQQQAVKFFMDGKKQGIPGDLLLKSAKSLFGGRVATETINMMGEAINAASGSAEERKAGAQTENIEARTNMLRQFSGGFGGQGAGGAIDPNQARSGAIGGMRPKGMSFGPSGPTMSFERDDPKPLGEAERTELREQTKQIAGLFTNARLLSQNKETLGAVMGPDATIGPALKRIGVEKLGMGGPAVKAFLNSIKQSGQVYRVAVTGAQAGLQEIQILLEQFPSEQDTVNDFLDKTYLTARVAQDILSRRIPALQAEGRDTRSLESLLATTQEGLQSMAGSMQPESLRRLESAFSNLGLQEASQQGTNRQQRQGAVGAPKPETIMIDGFEVEVE